MATLSDLVILLLGALLALGFYNKDRLLGSSSSSASTTTSGSSAATANGSKPTDSNGNGNAFKGDPRDFVARMKDQKKRLAVFYGSQTGTAEEYATRIAKEAKSRFGVSSLVCDIEEYDFEKLDQVPEDCAIVFCMATYGEGEPTDNAVQFIEMISQDDPEFSEGSTLDGLKYVVFGLGNKTYEQYNVVGRQLDARLTALGATRVGERGEGDDDKSMEEDYLAWKDDMFAALATTLSFEEGASGETPDFVVTEVPNHPIEKVFQGELSSRALLGSKGVHDAKNPYASPVLACRELFTGGDRNCIHLEFDITGSGITYQTGDHVAVWPSNPDVEVERLLAVLGLTSPEKRRMIIQVVSLDPTLAKVPFPTPTTYDAVFRHYLDISAVASRQTLAVLAKYAPSEQAAEFLTRLGTDKQAYHTEVVGGHLRLAEVLQLAAGNDITVMPTAENTTVWNIPFDHVVSDVSRLQPRFYSISSSPKLHPNSIHVTAVILKYESQATDRHPARWVFGLGTNYLLNVKQAANNETTPMISDGQDDVPEHVSAPKYTLEGPRGSYKHDDQLFKVPIHVRRSTFRLPTSPKIPVIMIGPGTGVAPFRGFIQERIALARRSIAKNGPDALADWAPIYLFYGSRDEQDFLYAEEWPAYEAELQGKFKIHVAFSRSGPRKPDGSKIYVQDLLWDQKEVIKSAIVEKRASVYICGDGRNMSKDVEQKLAAMLAESKNGSAAVEGAAEVKSLKERSRLLMDVWS
uniref:NADPH--cytochrome P450 reductase n=1 Tax=Phaffia rhodozyma TaxID=264483 RepID=A0A0P0K870_PHARH|nr:cytochrome P450 reductase [Phaffia rhodozyma]